MLNASRRFRYTLDLKKEEEKEKRRRMIRAHAQVIRVMLLSNYLCFYVNNFLVLKLDGLSFLTFYQAAVLFKLAGEKQIGMYFRKYPSYQVAIIIIEKYSSSRVQ